MQLYMFLKLPAAWFMGIRVKQCTLEQCEVVLPFSWRAQNPFKSIYFASECAAAEMSTGLLAMAHLQGAGSVSMLVVNIEADFFKKADQKLTFICSDGLVMKNTIQKALQTGEAQTFRAVSIGLLPDAQIAAKVYITWSFKVKK